MGKGLGIAGLVFAIIGIFVPVAGIFIAWLGLILVVFAALAGEVGFTVATIAISLVNFVVLSPSLWIATAGANLNTGPGSPNIVVIICVVLLVAPIVGFILRKTGKVMIGG